MQHNLLIPISMNDARHILGAAYKYAIDGAVKYGECPMCRKDPVETVIQGLHLGPQGQIIITGWCRSCKFKRQRLIDTHEFPNAYGLAMDLRALRIEG